MSSRPSVIPHWARPLDPPDCPEGWRTGPPDFVGVGVVRGGTTWWADVLEAHPQVTLARHPDTKGLHYFDRFWDGQAPDDLAEQYARFFPRPEGAVAGEFTARYMCDFWTPPLLATAAPRARLIVIMRDPVDRYISAVSRAMRRAEREDRQLRPQELSEAVYRGLYHKQMERLLEHFPREQVLLLQYERCRADPDGQSDATYRFLGLEPPPERGERTEVRSRPRRWKPQLSEDALRELVARYSDDVLALADQWPEIDLSLWPYFKHLAPAARAAGAPGA